MPGHLGAVSLKKSHDIVILSFCNIVKGLATYYILIYFLYCSCILPKEAIYQHCFDYNFWNYSTWLGKWNDGYAYDLYQKKRTCSIVTLIPENKQSEWIFEHPDNKMEHFSKCSISHEITKHFLYNVCPSIYQMLVLPTLN